MDPMHQVNNNDPLLTQTNAISNTLSPTKNIIRTVEILNGQDDIGVQDFVQNVKKAKQRCSKPELLLDFIIRY